MVEILRNVGGVRCDATAVCRTASITASTTGIDAGAAASGALYDADAANTGANRTGLPGVCVCASNSARDPAWRHDGWPPIFWPPGAQAPAQTTHAEPTVTTQARPGAERNIEAAP